MMRKNARWLAIFICVFACALVNCQVKTGLEVLKERDFDILKGKRVGLITNQTGIDKNFYSIVDILRSKEGINLVAIFAPEHGFLGGVQGDISDSIESKTKIPVYSLYGSTRTIPDEKLKDIDVIVFDIQDIGSRSYTYISTMKLAMEQAAKSQKEFVVLDRPNPVNGIIVDGPVLESRFISFIGTAEIPYVHGMTIGELALYFNSELKINCNLTVVPMKGWKRTMAWNDTGLVWVPTSPHIPESDTPLYYPITGVIGELSIVSVGVGYTLPFKIIGAPWIDAEKFSGELNKKNLPGVVFHPFYFKPYYGIYKDRFCAGARIIVRDAVNYKPFATGLAIMEVLLRLYPEEFNFSQKKNKDRILTFDKACGTDAIRIKLNSGEDFSSIESWYSSQIQDFIKKREKYLLY
ncbi:MAG: DUF1343 domain-containing protein [Candidatus Omnitrophica bacterium]|nr:DUF1343 domain-containing protein [Candidatus Omnitrophota bacterium]